MLNVLLTYQQKLFDDSKQKTKLKKNKKKITLNNKDRYKEEIGMIIEEELNSSYHKIFCFKILNCHLYDDVIRSCEEMSSFVLSHYNTDGLLETLTDINNHKMNNNMYIICVGYKDSLGGDVQIGFSGSENKHKNETPIDILQRECIEEIGNINCKNCITHISETFVCGKKAHTTIAVNLDEPRKLLTKGTCQINIPFNNFILRKKYSCVNGILYGNLKNTLHIVNLRGGKRPLHSRDNIDKIFVVPLRTAVKMVTSLRKSFEGNTTWYLNKTTLIWEKIDLLNK